MKIKSRQIFTVLLLLLTLAGCGKMSHVRGKVTFSDGSPVPCGMVIFQQTNYQARGDIQPDGSYRMGSLKKSDGLPPGTYSVFLSGVVENKPEGDLGMIETIELVDPKFTGSDSGLTFTVEKGKNRFDFSVDRLRSSPVGR